MSGMGGSVHIFGSRGKDSLSGGNGKDTLLSPDGDDTLDGGNQIDKVRGGNGEGVFVFKHGYGMNTIVDFENDVDLIHISLWSSSISFGALTIRVVETEVKIFLAGQTADILGLQDALITDITEADFIFS